MSIAGKKMMQSHASPTNIYPICITRVLQKEVNTTKQQIIVPLGVDKPHNGVIACAST